MKFKKSQQQLILGLIMLIIVLIVISTLIIRQTGKAEASTIFIFDCAVDSDHDGVVDCQDECPCDDDEDEQNLNDGCKRGTNYNEKDFEKDTSCLNKKEASDN